MTEIPQTRDSILKSAQELFSNKGFDRVSASEIAEAARVNKALIFYYFGSKEKLYRTILSLKINEMRAALEKGVSGVDPGLEVIEAFVRAHISFLRSNQNFFYMFLRELLLPSSRHTELFHEVSGLFAGLQSILKDAFTAAKEKGEIRDVDPLQTIISIISLDVFFFFMKKPFAEMHTAQQQTSTEEFESARIDNVLDMILNGIKASQ